MQAEKYKTRTAGSAGRFAATAAGEKYKIR
jgi:hypothetical protein